MTEAALVFELRRLADEVAALALLVQRLAPTPPPDHAALLQVLKTALPAPFSSAEVLDLAALPLSTREPLRRALAERNIKTAHQLGMLLDRVARTTAGQPLRLVRVCKEDNTRLWALEGAEGA